MKPKKLSAVALSCKVLPASTLKARSLVLVLVTIRSRSVPTAVIFTLALFVTVSVLISGEASSDTSALVLKITFAEAPGTPAPPLPPLVADQLAPLFQFPPELPTQYLFCEYNAEAIRNAATNT